MSNPDKGRARIKSQQKGSTRQVSTKTQDTSSFYKRTTHAKLWQKENTCQVLAKEEPIPILCERKSMPSPDKTRAHAKPRHKENTCKSSTKRLHKRNLDTRKSHVKSRQQDNTCQVSAEGGHVTIRDKRLTHVKPLHEDRACLVSAKGKHM